MKNDQQNDQAQAQEGEYSQEYFRAPETARPARARRAKTGKPAGDTGASVPDARDARIAELEHDLEEHKQATESRVRRILEHAARIVELEKTNTAQARRIEDLERQAETGEKWRAQLREAIDRASKEAVGWKERCLKAEGEKANLAAQVDTLTEQAAEGSAAQVDALTARLVIVEKENADLRREKAQVQAERDSAAAIVEDLTGQYRQLGEENTSLRTALAEREDSQAAADPQEIAELRKQLADERELRAFDARIVQEYYEFKAWLKALWKNPHIESARKVGEIGLAWMIDGHQDAHGYADVNIEHFSKTCGFSRQTGARVLHESVASGAHSEVIELEECMVRDKRNNRQRKIEKKHYRLSPTRLREHPADLRKPEGQNKQGGAGNRCKGCGRENVLRHIFHTYCPECNKEDIHWPEDLLAIKDRFKSEEAIQASDAPAAVAEAEKIFAQVAPIAPIAPAQAVEEVSPAIAVQDEQEPAPVVEVQPAPVRSIESETMLAARREGWPALALPGVGVQIAPTEAAWSRWMWMSHATKEQITAVHAAVVLKQQPATPAPWDRPCDHCGGIETIYDPDGSGRRICACYIHPERRRRVWEEETPAPATHKAVNLSTGQIVEVSDEE